MSRWVRDREKYESGSKWFCDWHRGRGDDDTAMIDLDGAPLCATVRCGRLMTFRECDLDAIDPRLFAIYYAIRLPDGRLHSAVEYERPASWLLFGGGRERDRGAITRVAPCVFATRDDAQQVLDTLRADAARIGIPYFGAVIVAALRTPFVTDGTDPATTFAEHVAHWMAQQQEDA